MLKSATTGSGTMMRLRNYFLTGVIVCAPLAITAYLSLDRDPLGGFLGQTLYSGTLQSGHLPAVPGARLRPGGGAGHDHHDRLPHRQHHRPLDRLLRREAAEPHAAGAQCLQRPEADLRDRAGNTRRACSAGSGCSSIRASGIWSMVFIAAEEDSEINEALSEREGKTIAVFLPDHPQRHHRVPALRAGKGRHSARNERRGCRQAADLGRPGRRRNTRAKTKALAEAALAGRVLVAEGTSAGAEENACRSAGPQQPHRLVSAEEIEQQPDRLAAFRDQLAGRAPRAASRRRGRSPAGRHAPRCGPPGSPACRTGACPATRLRRAASGLPRRCGSRPRSRA